MSNPPEYEEALLRPNEPTPPRNDGDVIPDDFKYSVSVSECTMDIRHGFLSRVYLLLGMQLTLTAGLSAVIMFVPGVQSWALTHQWLLYVSMFGAIGLMIGAMVLQRRWPWNLVLLGLFTLAESYLVGVVSSLYDTRIVINAFVITMVVFFGLSAFAVQTRYDLTSWLPYLCASLFALIALGFIGLFTNSTRIELAYSIIAVVVFSGFILVDTQVIMTQFSPEDEIAASIELYLDILNLFLNILRLLSSSDDN